ncbi:RagB/SusD family nutrient uptake outer membrane protein [Sphingobacterium wenxiniae]|uniref:Starch-binding associating with outer membrane n=1 Tax=Sphingobacterium wenxiniae TaxID=683125 RepID=A0A1I6RB16_9SPHI|nr:RagB/SusD family nutrient uptake outer membrane protein [Sphingobacterium wenxiniae]SFS61923.1 Starch-binding associating with outer membrane [Sphingobacterium wenxiniae]
MFKTKIKYKIFGASLLALCLSFSSCEKFTELDPLSALSETTAFTTPENIELAVNGMYWQAAVGTYNGGAGRGYPFGGASIEQGEMRGEDMVNLQAFFQITYQNTYNVTSANNVNHWEQLYALINQCNVIIEGVDGAVSAGVLSAEVANPYKGEALFLRALSHHELLIHFARPYADNPTSNLGVPYRTIAITSAAAASEANALERGTVADAYAKLLADLDEAENILPATRSSAAARISRATKGAAIALKTRIKLHQADYKGVIAEGAKLGTDASSAPFQSSIGGFRLEADPTTPFLSYTNNVESIFSVAQSIASNGGVNGAISGMLGPSALNGRDLVAISPNFYNIDFWLADDVRKKELTYKQSAGDRPFVYTYKFRKYGDNDDWNPILRYSEVLLNVAEAYAYDGNDAQALRLLNAVRDRAVGAANSFGATAPSDLKKAIYNERRIEFSAEGKRWGDVHRLALSPYGTGGIPAKVLPQQLSSAVYDGSTILTPAQAVVAYSEYVFLWPIPQSELDANPVLRGQQNPGW